MPACWPVSVIPAGLASYAAPARAASLLETVAQESFALEAAAFAAFMLLLLLMARWTQRHAMMARSALNSVLEAEPECVKITDENGCLVQMNPAGLRMIDAQDDPGQVLGMQVSALVEPEDRAAFEAMNARVLRGESCTLQFHMRGLKGARRCMETHAVPVRNPLSRRLQVLSITRDITDKRQAEAQLERSNKLLDAIRRAQEMAISDISSRPVFDELLEILLTHTESPYGLIGEVQQDPQGEPFLQVRAVSRLGGESGSAAGLALELRSRDSLIGQLLQRQQVVMADASSPMPEHSGLPEGHPQLETFLGLPLMQRGEMIGIAVVANRAAGYDDALCRHIQPLIAACGTLVAAFSSDQARQRSEQELQLAHMVFESTGEAIVVTDEANRIIAVNPAYTRVTGYRLEEVIGKDPGLLRSGRHTREFYQAMWHAIETTGQWQGEIWNRHKSGAEFAEWLTINTIFGQDGRVLRRVALFSDITDKKKADVLLWTHENYDQLTGLPNRRLLVDRLEHEIKKAGREHFLVAALLVDLDHFNHINDNFGFEIGDQVLVEVGKRIRQCVRESDTVSRAGGDEFIVVLTDLDDAGEIGRIAQDLIYALEKPFLVSGQEVSLSACVGAAAYPDDAHGAAELLVAAGHAVKHAQQEGKGHFRCYTQSMQEAALIRLRLARELKQALLEQQFTLFYQPIVELATDRLYKAEALIRWNHPQHGLIGPAAFIPVAEDTGTIQQIGDWVFHQAVQQVKSWRQAYDPQFQVSINKSPVQFRDREGIHSHWVEHLREMALSGDAIVVEITEGLLMDAEGPIIEKLLHFSHAGVQVAIDDFGTGYSSLSYLKKFDIDYLKIDQSFTRNLAPDNEDMALCEAIVVMAHKLGLKVIAEGVETAQQRDLLRQIGCDFGQGFFYAKPLPAEAFERCLQERLAAEPATPPQFRRKPDSAGPASPDWR